MLYLAPVLAALILFAPAPVRFLKRVLIIFLFPLSASIFIPIANRGSSVFSIDLGPFVLNVTDQGLMIFYTTIIKSFFSIVIFTALVVSSRDIELLGGLRKIHFPKIMVSIIFLMYRYIFLIRDEARAGQIAINSRVFERSYNNVNKRLAFLAGTLFIKSFDRAENIYKSMESRGFEGEFHDVAAPAVSPKSGAVKGWLITGFFAIVLAAIKSIELLELL